MPKVFVTNWPDTELEVDSSEFTDLSRQGLIVPDKGDVDKDGALKEPKSDEKKGK